MREFGELRKKLNAQKPSFPKYRHILKNRTLRCLASKAGKRKELPVPGGEITHYKVSQDTRINSKFKGLNYTNFTLKCLHISEVFSPRVKHHKSNVSR